MRIESSVLLATLLLGMICGVVSATNTTFTTNLPPKSHWSLIILSTTPNDVVYGANYDNVNITNTSIKLNSTFLPPLANASNEYTYLALFNGQALVGYVGVGEVNTLTFDPGAYECSVLNPIICAQDAWNYMVALIGKAQNDVTAWKLGLPKVVVK